jgi:hypothetical protein
VSGDAKGNCVGLRVHVRELCYFGVHCGSVYDGKVVAQTSSLLKVRHGLHHHWVQRGSCELVDAAVLG